MEKRGVNTGNSGRRNKTLFVIVSALFCMLGCLQGTMQVYAENAQEVKERWYDTRYYPLYQGNEEWQKHDMLATLDILNPPHDLLLSMSTEELATLMQEHPLMNQITSYWGMDGNQDYATFYEFMEVNSDIFYELLRREDGYVCIMEAYRKHEIDVELLNTDDYDSVEEAGKALDMFWQEVYGCQFIHHYAHHFTESEYRLAVEILEEKAEVYKGLTGGHLYNLDLSQLEWNGQEERPAVRANYLAEEQIREKEKKLAAALAEMEQKEEPEQEQVSDPGEELEKDVVESETVAETTDVRKTGNEKQNGGLPKAGILLGILSVIIGVLCGRKKKK